MQKVSRELVGYRVNRNRLEDARGTLRTMSSSTIWRLRHIGDNRVEL